MMYEYRTDNRTHLTDYNLYEEVCDKLGMHNPNTTDNPEYAERLGLEYDEQKGLYLNPYKE